MATQIDFGRLTKAMSEVNADILLMLDNYENSKIEWERELFAITKNIFKESIQPVLLEKIETKAVERDFILLFIFLQIRIEAQQNLKQSNTHIFEYHFEYDKQSTNIMEQLIGKRVITLKKKEADEFVRMLLTVPVMLVHYLQTNNSNWLNEYMLKHQELLKIEMSNNRSQKISVKEVTLSEKDELIKVIAEKKNELRKKRPGKKISISAVASEFNRPYSSFRDILKNHKIIFSDL